MIFLSYEYGERADKNSSVHLGCPTSVSMTPDVMPQNQSQCQSPSTPEELCRNPIFIMFMDWGKKLFLHISLLLSRPYTCHPHTHTSHSSCYLSAAQRIPGDEFIAVSLYVIHTRTYTTSHTWCLWKVLSVGRIPYVIMFDFRLYFNHYITFEICELRLYVSLPFHLPGLLISVIPSQHTCVQVFP